MSKDIPASELREQVRRAGLRKSGQMDTKGIARSAGKGSLIGSLAAGPLGAIPGATVGAGFGALKNFIAKKKAPPPGAMDKLMQSGLMQKLISGGKQGIKSTTNWWDTLDPNQRTAVMGGGGALAGGLLGGGVGKATGQGVLGPALLGALLGGAGGAGIPAGLKMMNTGAPEGGSSMLSLPAALKNIFSLPGAAGGVAGAHVGVGRGYLTGGTKGLAPNARKGMAEGWKSVQKPQTVTRVTGKHTGNLGGRMASKLRGGLRGGLRQAGYVGKKGLRAASKGKKGLAMIPIGLILGALANRQLKGEF